MRARAHALSLSLFLLWPAWAVAAEPANTSATAFARLSSLVGTWEGTFEDGRPHSVTYRLTAGGTVLVETWTLGAARESLTLYHLDGDALVATHYCPQGNQPRLQLSSTPESPERLAFAFRDGGNLQVKGKSHQHAFWIELKSRDVFLRSETYVENGSNARSLANAHADAAITYTRAGSGQ
ncbi:MAG: hypothetical protein ABIO38_09815 [Luteimonas sp.]